jgi:hypothetical protein
MTDHWETATMSGPCRMPPFHESSPKGQKAHLGKNAYGVYEIYCAAHCPHCNPEPPPDRTGKVVTLAGEQGGLFG